VFKNYLKIAFRNIRKYNGYSFINIAGLSVGIAIMLLILLFVCNELSYDTFNENYHRIYRIESGDWCVMPAGIGHILDGQIPEIQKVVRFKNWEKLLVKYNRNFYKIENLSFADPSVFDVFTFQFLVGSPENCFKNPYSIILTESTARTMFGDTNPIGQTIHIKNRFNYTVTGVLKDIKNFHFSIDAMVSFLDFGRIFGEEVMTRLDDGWEHPTYCLLPENHHAKEVEQKINRFIAARKYFKENSTFQLRPLKGLYFMDTKDYYRKHGNIRFVRMFVLIAFFVLLIACINFVNLTTSKASQRAREVGIKKVVGALRNQLIQQFLVESMLICIIALIIGFSLAHSVVPTFNRIISGDLDILYFYQHPYPLLFTGGALLLGLIAGVYPAFYLSAFKPIVILKGLLTRSSKGARLRKTLIVFQFSISIVLVIATLTVFKQLIFMKNADLGFQKEHVVTLDLNRSLRNKKDVFKNELLRHPNITGVTYSCRVPGEDMWLWSPLINGKRKSIHVNAIDPDFFQTYAIKMADGRNFSWERNTDQDNKFIVNKTALKFFEIESPIGQKVEKVPNGSGIGEIIGVVKDFHFNSLHTNIGPVIFYWLDWPHGKVSIRISLDSTDGALTRMHRVLGFIKERWEDICFDYPFEYTFLDEHFDRQYKGEESLSKIFFGFAMLAIFIACMGLFGLASFATAQRTKEIGIRKVLGASVSSILILFSREFTKLVLLSCIIALPVAWFTMQRWLENFAYRTRMGLSIFLFAGILCLTLALVTVGFQAIKAALANPVEALRME